MGGWACLGSPQGRAGLGAPFLLAGGLGAGLHAQVPGGAPLGRSTEAAELLEQRVIQDLLLHGTRRWMGCSGVLYWFDPSPGRLPWPRPGRAQACRRSLAAVRLRCLGGGGGDVLDVTLDRACAALVHSLVLR